MEIELNLKEEYFMIYQRRGRFLDNLHSGMLKRGRLCGRGCGCCRDLKLGVGHCTTECGCCQQARGVVLTDKAQQTMRSLYPRSSSQNRPYYRKMMLVSIYGLADGHTENPFDLIDGPLSYEQSSSSQERLQHSD